MQLLNQFMYANGRFILSWVFQRKPGEYFRRLNTKTAI
jgi:hypothetical protein